MQFTNQDIQQIESKGINTEEIENQLKQFESGINAINLDNAATLDKGIYKFSEHSIQRMAAQFDERKSEFNLMKFVPASGAASRMFKSLYSLREILRAGKKHEKDTNEYTALQKFVTGLKDFAFYKKMLEFIDNPEQKLKEENYLPFIDALLNTDALNYANKPKAFIDFHSYADDSRNAFREQIIEAVYYLVDADKNLNIHFTINPEFEEEMKEEYLLAKQYITDKYALDLNVSWSFQKSSTDTIAVDMENLPFKKKNGDLLFRPGGHGALLQNINELDTDILFLKNIDNIVHESKIEESILYKKALAAHLIKLLDDIHANLEILDDGNISDDDLNDILEFATEKLAIQIPDYISGLEKMEKIDYLFVLFNRPLRVCGMVKNEGEAGGGPFYVVDDQGYISLQIVEASQIDRNNTEQADILASSTHFNPVDLICYLRDFNGNRFDLNDFCDPNNGFISEKSYEGSNIKALELPGLWNAAMADWITIFVEVPLSTFNPVKEVNDLLRENHLPS